MLEVLRGRATLLGAILQRTGLVPTKQRLAASLKIRKRVPKQLLATYSKRNKQTSPKLRDS